MESFLLSADQFMDTAYAPSFLANHGAGVGRGDRLELLTPEAHDAPPVHVDHMYGVASGPVPLHGFPAPPPGVAPPSLQLHGAASHPVPLHGTPLRAPRPASSAAPPEPATPTPLSGDTALGTPTASISTPESPIFDDGDASSSSSDSPIVQSPPTSSPTPAPLVYTVPVTHRQRGIVQKNVRTDGTIAWNAVLAEREASPIFWITRLLVVC
jgi:hypothetical protein